MVSSRLILSCNIISSEVTPPARVVAPALTPIGYNPLPVPRVTQRVVAPALTPIGYNLIGTDGLDHAVVAPALTPIGYNSCGELSPGFGL